ncbi:MAG: ABC transporter ATP-binding protein [Balneolaceae bacterium]|nr:ABC transporter ATP-binding protein [Balneolaceae bacterium]
MISVNVHNLGKRYGSTTVFKNLSFSFDTGVLGIAGSNGSGKSTLLKCLAGLERVSSGTITWRQDEHQLSEIDFRKRLGFVAPYINLYHELTVRENLELVLQLRKREISHQKKQELWNQLQLTGLEEKHFGELSTGQRQRARLACTLSYDPSILFLDEPEPTWMNRDVK